MPAQNYRHIATAFICALALSLVFLLLATPAYAQDEIEADLRKLSPAKVAELNAILAEPTPIGGLHQSLRNHFRRKELAAKQLGDMALAEKVLVEAITFLPDPSLKNNLANLYAGKGQYDEAEKLIQASIAAVPNSPEKLISIKNWIGQLYGRRDINRARVELVKAHALIKELEKRNFEDWEREVYLRGRAQVLTTESLIYEHVGEHKKSIELAMESEKYARQALVTAQRLNDSYAPPRLSYATAATFSAIRRRVSANRVAGRLQDAEIALQELFRFARENVVAETTSSTAMYTVASQMRFTQRIFGEALQYADRAITIETKNGTVETASRLISQRHDRIVALMGLKKWSDAGLEFELLDRVTERNPKVRSLTRHYRTRGSVYLGLDQNDKAVIALKAGFAAYKTRYGEQHEVTLSTKGLLGVALWRQSKHENSLETISLLSDSILGLMSQEDAQLNRDAGLRREMTELIYRTYMDALAQTQPIQALQALGLADQMRNSLVQEALGDAAVRAATSNDALSNLVRQDQDARNEIKGLRNYLSGEAGGATSPLPQVAAQMRERIALLEKTRAEVQVKIKAAFPDYERLVRPLPPSTIDIQAKLKPAEALIVLQPTNDAVFVWAVNQQGTGAFHRANLTNVELSKLVKRLRTSLDVAGIPENRRPAFDHAAAQELYAKLLAPVQQGLAGKTSLIVAAGGVLGQIPFGVLQTADKDSWLIKQAAITHVPSVAAWLSMRSLPHQTAPQPMLAWGDPLFNIALAGNTSATKGEVRKVVLTRANTAVDLEKEDPRSALKYANISPLPETRDELVAIAKTLGADAAKDLILGSAATRESVLAQNKNGNLAKQRVVAFATHGLMAGDLPNLTQPALAMAGTKDDATNVLAPLLTLEDVLILKLNADWVVLSACNTAAADGKAEEALSGLARGFFYAGSRSLLVTHWAVDSESAVTLTTETFKNYQSKPTEAKAESLRQAMLKVMSDPATAHPTYWAPYALVGDGAR